MAKSAEHYVQFQQYTDHIDTSDVILGYYRNQSGSGFQKYILMIEDWLETDHENIEDNKPLVIQADGGVGKKTLLNKWHDYHESIKQQKRKDLILMHFATTGGNNSNYFYALYRILVKLRETLNIGQKVELHEEKLRKYFSYWLQVCNDTIENQVINNPEIIYEKIILVFEGIDYFADRDTNREGNIAFWLPKYFPKHIKVIVTADRQSETMKHFTRLGCHKLSIAIDGSIVKAMVKAHCQKKLCVNQPLRSKLVAVLDELLVKEQHISLYAKVFLSTLLPDNADNLADNDPVIEAISRHLLEIDQQKLKTLPTVDSLLDYVLEFWGRRIFRSEDKFRELMGLFVCTQKGLTRSEILLISKVTSEELKLFGVVFGNFLMKYRHLWMIKNDSFRKCLNHKYKFKFQDIHERIAEALRKTPNSLRKLEEETYQLYNAKSYFKLKEIISDIENFLLLFNSYNKYDLCRYWQKLEEKSFDPVIEYNKAVESFEMHYHPSSEDLFRITVQISRFLKEFADFETYYTPRFRHPEILGNLNQLDEIGLLGEFSNLELCNAIQGQPTDEKYTEGMSQKSLEERVKLMAEKIEKGKVVKRDIVQPKDEPKQLDKQQKEKKKKKQLPVQQYNVEVKTNQANFRQFYYKQIKGFLKKVALDKSAENENVPTIEQEQHSDDEEEPEENDRSRPAGFDKEKMKQYEFSNLRRLFSESVEEQFELNQKPPANYYYKRWIWMQFPWVCMTMKCDYSSKIKRCFTSPTQYMTVSEEKEFTMQSLKIALQAKRKKQSVLEQKSYRKDDINIDRTKSSFVEAAKTTQKFLTEKNVVENRLQPSRVKRIDEIAYLTNSFLNLQNLTQQIENINNTKGVSNKPLKQQQDHSVFLTQGDRSHLNSSDLTYSKNTRRKPTNHEDLANTKIKQGLLPRIKHNMNNEMQRELEVLQKNNASMRKQMDSYLYMNKVLAKKLKELKIIEFNNMNQVKNVKRIDETKKKIETLQEKLKKIKNHYAYSLLQQERLNILIKICKCNKTQNEEAIPPLTFECSNFKKMIKWETEAIEQINRETEEIKKISNKFLMNCSEKIDNEIHLTEEIKSTLKNRSQFDTEVQKYDSMILKEVTYQRKLIDQEIKDVLVHKQHREGGAADKNKRAVETAESYEHIYKELAEYLPLADEQYKQSTKYLWFVEQMNKKREFDAIIEQRKLRLEQLQKQYRDELHELETFQKAANEVQTGDDVKVETEEACYAYEDHSVQEREIHEKQRVYTKLLESKLSCLGMLNTWCARMGLPETKKLHISDDFVTRLKELLPQPEDSHTPVHA